MKKIAIALINFYRQNLSHRPLPRCRYHPGCSEYAVSAIYKYGLFFGLLKSAWRIIRCNPISRGGLDLP